MSSRLERQVDLFLTSLGLLTVVAARGVFTSVPDLARKLRRYINIFHADNKPKASQQLQRVGDVVIALSGLALLGSVLTFLNSTPPMGELVHFTHDIFDPLGNIGSPLSGHRFSGVGDLG